MQVLNGKPWNAAQNLRTWEVLFTVQIPPPKSIRGPQNQLSEQHRKTKLAWRTVERVKLCPPWANLASFDFLSAMEPGIFKWQFISEGIRKAVHFMLPTPKMCDNRVGGDKRQASTPEEYIHISDSLRLTMDSENAAVETRDYHSKHCSRPAVVILQLSRVSATKTKTNPQIPQFWVWRLSHVIQWP